MSDQPLEDPITDEKLARVLAWWPAVARIASFFVGTGIMVHETVIVHVDRYGLIGAALVMMGVPIASALDRGMRIAEQASTPKGTRRE